MSCDSNYAVSQTYTVHPTCAKDYYDEQHSHIAVCCNRSKITSFLFLLHDKPSNESTYLNITEKEGTYTELNSSELDYKKKI